MNCRHIHANCISFTASALLMAAIFCSIQCTPALAGESPANAAKPPAPASATRPFTEIQLKKINQYWDTKGMQIDIKPQYSRLIGLTKGDEVARAHSVSGRDENNILHIFARLNNGAGYYLTREPSPDEMHLYWVGFDFKVIAAISVSKDNGTAVIPAAEAQKELASEYAEWIEFADTL